MCGIAGIVLHADYALENAMGRAARMCDAMTHRGPDDAGIFQSSDGRVILTNRRLAIQDVSPLGHMPMQNDDDTITLTYNGEIYNTDSLRAELERAGCHFRSHSDTEVILRGYEIWGDAVIARLRGIFALALYDARKGVSHARMLLARDPLGVKPLYYARTSSRFVFASELNALRASGMIGNEMDAASIVAYLELGAVPAPHTIFQDVYTLEPGTMLTCQLAEMQWQPARYWSLPDTMHPAPDDAVEFTRAALQDAVRTQLVSDVPLGAFLSGGLDSSAVVALMRRATNGTLRTCSMVFEEAQYSEASFARAVADQVGSEHFERIVTARDVARELPHILKSLDQPSIDGVNTYFVSQTARQAGLTVALSGLGGDELFGGYPTFTAAPRLQAQLRRVQTIPGGTSLARTSLSFAPNATRYHKIQDVLQQPVSTAGAYFAYRGVFSRAETKTLVTRELWEAAQGFDAIAYIAQRAQPDARASQFQWTSRAELNTYTLNQLLRDTDVMSMAHSLEVRVPLLDPYLVQLVLSLPDATKQNGGAPKPLLQNALGDLLPPLVRNRRIKQGFTFPFADWLRADLKTFFAPYSFASNPVLNAQAAQRVLEQFARGQRHWSRAWSLLTLNAWLQENSVRI